MSHISKDPLISKTFLRVHAFYGLTRMFCGV